MLKSVKWCSTVLAFLVFFASGACLVACAFASDENPNATQECHSTGDQHKSSGHSGQKENHDADSSCCPSLVAINNSYSSVISADAPSEKIISFYSLTPEKFISENLFVFRYGNYHPPGLSPPQYFLFTNTSHAPPLHA